MTAFNAPSLPAPSKFLSHAHVVRAQETIYLSGQCGVDPASGAWVEGTVADRTAQCMKNIEIVLKDMGLDLTALVSCTIYLSKYTEDFAAMNGAYVAAFPEGHQLPARCCIGVANLPQGTDVEISAIAARE